MINYARFQSITNSTGVLVCCLKLEENAKASHSCEAKQNDTSVLFWRVALFPRISCSAIYSSNFSHPVVVLFEGGMEMYRNVL
jgi:hypothetical protein